MENLIRDRNRFARLPQDGGYPADRDLDQLTDDGCRLIPDPARWSDAEYCDTVVYWGESGVPAAPRDSIGRE
jgi:hypothetical protein